MLIADGDFIGEVPGKLRTYSIVSVFFSREGSVGDRLAKCLRCWAIWIAEVGEKSLNLSGEGWGDSSELEAGEEFLDFFVVEENAAGVVVWGRSRGSVRSKRAGGPGGAGREDRALWGSVSQGCAIAESGSVSHL